MRHCARWCHRQCRRVLEVGIVRQRYTPFGGAERFVADALVALSRENVALSLYTRRWPGGDSTTFTPVICDPFHIGNVWRDWSFARCVRNRWRQHRPHLVQSHERIAGCDIFRAGDGVHRVWLAERRRGMTPLEKLLLALNPYHHYTLAAEARMFTDAGLRAVICNSKLVRDQIASLFDVPATKLHVIYNAVDALRFAPPRPPARAAMRRELALPDDAVVFMFVGSGYARKGVANVLAALAALARSTPNVRLVVAGKERRLDEYRRRAHALGVVDRVIFRGAETNVARLLHAADAFVLPTIYDPLPNAVLEAMATGLPVITSTQCGAAELLLEHDAGLVCDAHDVDAIATAMRRLVDDPSLRVAMGERARAAVAPLTAPAMTAELLALYRSLLPGAL